jgi:hypothetical protein
MKKLATLAAVLALCNMCSASLIKHSLAQIRSQAKAQSQSQVQAQLGDNADEEEVEVISAPDCGCGVDLTLDDECEPLSFTDLGTIRGPLSAITPASGKVLVGTND